MKQIEKCVYRSYLHRLQIPSSTPRSIGEISLTHLLEMNLELYLFDGFGTLYLNDRAMPGAVYTWNTLKALGHKVALLTNSASRSDAQIAHSARLLGFHIEESEVFSSGRFFLETHQLDLNQRYFHIGNDFGKQRLIDNGFVIYDDNTCHHIILSGPCKDSSTAKAQLKVARHILNSNPLATLHLLNPDACAPLHMGKKFEVSGAYAWHLDPKIQRQVHIYGKPSPSIFLWTCESMGISPLKSIMIGDTLGTDIAGAQNAQISTALCLQGNSNIDNICCDMKELGIIPDNFLSFCENE